MMFGEEWHFVRDCLVWVLLAVALVAAMIGAVLLVCWGGWLLLEALLAPL